MSDSLLQHVTDTLADIDSRGLSKHERPLLTPQSTHIEALADGKRRDVINMCANNYLGLANHPVLIEAAIAGLREHGFGMASVRFICGTQDIHKTLEQQLAVFLQMEDSILFSSCFDANAGIFEVLLQAEDAIISDSLNHASIIDGIRLCKAQRFRYANNDMDDLETQLRAAQSCRYRLVVTDGVFSMDGTMARLPQLCELAEQYDALVMVDDSHAVGFVGERGAGTAEAQGVEGRVHIVSGTFGKALGGASGGYIAGPRPIVELLRQRARPYLFSNSLAPPIVNATLKALEILQASGDLRQRLRENTLWFRNAMQSAGFNVIEGSHPIVPVMIGDARQATALADALMQQGIYVTAFSFPVVPEGQARIRTQVSAAHSREELEQVVGAFVTAAETVGGIHS